MNVISKWNMLYLLKLAAWLWPSDLPDLGCVGYMLPGWLTSLGISQAANLKTNQGWVFASDFLEGKHHSLELNSDTTVLSKSSAETRVKQRLMLFSPTLSWEAFENTEGFKKSILVWMIFPLYYSFKLFGWRHQVYSLTYGSPAI